jgi:membrane-bound lytic murein transglycosylase A
VDEVTHSNPSFIFFHVTEEEAPGAMGVKLTGGRSLAVDRDYIPLGIPVFVKTTNTYDNSAWHRLMFAQDVGSAIQGPVRGDIYFGHGPLAGQRAGRQNASGKLWALVPKENVGMQAAAAATPISDTAALQTQPTQP